MHRRQLVRHISLCACMLTLLVLPSISLDGATGAALAQRSDAYDVDTSTYQYEDPALSALDEEEPPGEPLSLDEAIALGVRNNLDVEVNRYAPYASQLDSEAAWGAYDPVFSGDVSYSGELTRNTFLINPVTESITSVTGGNAGLSALVPYVGATVELRFDGARTSTNSAIEALVPRYDSGFSVGGSIPLLRGLVWNEPWTQVKTSRLAFEEQLDTFTTSVMDTVQSIVSAYWNLVATKEQVRVARKSLQSNLALLDQTQTQYDVGVVSKVEVVEAEAGVANSEFELIRARNAYRNAQDQLIAAVLGDRLRATTTLIFDPTTNPEFSSVQPVDLEQAVETAFAQRPELSAAARRLDQGKVQLKYAKNQRLPQLDVDVSYRTTGTRGAPNPDAASFGGGGGNPIASVDPVILGGFGDTFGDYYGAPTSDPDGIRDPHEFRAMATVSIPLGNVTARKNVSKARIELRRANSQITRLKQQIIVAVRTAARGLLASAQGVEAAERRRLAAEEQLRAEKIRLEHGESTPFDVLQRERDLVDAESQKIAALQAFRNSQAELERQQGTILDAFNVQIENVRQLDYQAALERHD